MTIRHLNCSFLFYLCENRHEKLKYRGWGIRREACINCIRHNFSFAATKNIPKMAVRPGTVQPSVTVKDQLPNIKKLIMEAQTLDDNGDEMVS